MLTLSGISKAYGERVLFADALLQVNRQDRIGLVGSNGSAAYADLDSGLAVGVMRNRIVGDWAVAAAIARLVTEAFDR